MNKIFKMGVVYFVSFFSTWMVYSNQKPKALTDLSLEELMNIEVTLTSRKAENLFETASAFYVIPNEDLKRLGVNGIHDALRMVPGIQVAQLDANKWAISSRGFNSLFSNKLLLLVDGRSTYNPIFSGVFWETQNIIFRDVEQIEVIKGPGATMWGTNAVNGIINIVTKSSYDTQGGWLNLGYGTQGKGFGDFRYGGKIYEGLSYRIYGQYMNRDGQLLESGDMGADNWSVYQGGFRLDWMPSQKNSFLLQGDIYHGHVGQTLILDYLGPIDIGSSGFEIPISGSNLMGRWNYTFSDDSDFLLQIYFDRAEREDSLLMGGMFQQFDMDFQHRFPIGEKHRIIWGLGCRTTNDVTDSTQLGYFQPDRRRYNRYSAFIQDEIVLKEDRLRFTVGSKFEYNDIVGLDIQPSGRILWALHKKHRMWAAVSRAARSPSRADQDILYGTYELPELRLALKGSRDVPSEILIAYELGYRLRPAKHLFFDLSTFFHRYSKLRTFEPDLPLLINNEMNSHVILPFKAGSKKYGHTYGLEFSFDYMLKEGWRIHGTYNYLNMKIKYKEDIVNLKAVDPAGESPSNQLTLISMVDIKKRYQFDTMLRYMDDLSSIRVHEYVELDMRLGCQIMDKLTLSITGRNLLHGSHLEFVEPLIPFESTKVQREYFTSIGLEF